MVLYEHELSRQPFTEHTAIWRWIGENVEHRSRDQPDRPLRPPVGDGRDLRLIGAYVAAVGDNDGPGYVPYSVQCYDGSAVRTFDQSAEGLLGGRLAGFLFGSPQRGAAYVFGQGARRDLHLLFRAFWRDWLRLGYSLTPIARGANLRAIIVRRGKSTWTLVDWAALTGFEREAPDESIDQLAGPYFKNEGPAIRAYVAASNYAAIVKRHFGVTASALSGRTGVAALARCVPNDGWLWPPSDLAVTLCRLGGAFRGGYCYYPSYRGPGWKIDLRRAYCWALSQELPNGYAVAPYAGDRNPRMGIYLCRVRGPGILPALLAPLSGGPEPPRRRLWSGNECDALLPVPDIAGLRALGYRVTPGWGLVARSTVRFDGLRRAVESVIAAYGPDSPEGRVAKVVPNAAYGCLAAPSDRWELTFSDTPPSSGALPMIDAVGDEVEGAWYQHRTARRAYQHVDIAAFVTSSIRARLYAMADQLDRQGISVVAADTDGLVVSGQPGSNLLPRAPGVGDWRDCGYDPNVIINGPRFAAIDGRAFAAGTGGVTVQDVALAYDRGTVTVAGKVMAPPWQEGATRRTVTKVLRRA